MKTFRHTRFGGRFPLILASCLALVVGTGQSSCEDYDGGFPGDGNGPCSDGDSGRPETCNGLDDDCDGDVDEGVTTTFYADQDGDGYGTLEDTAEACEAPAGYVTVSGDCDDTRADANPAAEETCNGLDDDCDGAVDEGVTTTFYADQDGDGYGDSSDTAEACAVPDGYAAVDGDCDDTRADANPAAEEACNGLDDDCDGDVDEGLPTTEWLLDGDGDGFGTEETTVESCGPLDGVTDVRGDCDDDDPGVYPGATDVAGDGLDADCGGTEGPDPHVGLGPDSLETIQAALDVAGDGQTVWVGPGTYLEHELTMDGKAIALRSTHGASATTIDAEQLGSVMQFTNGEGVGTLLDGFTIMGGSSSYYGGGLYLSGVSVTLKNLIVTENVAQYGGGISASNSVLVLTDVTIANNIVRELVQYDGVEGPALDVWSSSATLTRVVVDGNLCDFQWGGCLGAMTMLNSDVTLAQSVISGNENSGGLWFVSGSATVSQVAVIDNCWVGMTIDGSVADLTWTTVERNGGGGIALRSFSGVRATSTLTHVTVVWNTGDGIRAEYGGAVNLDQVAVLGNGGAGLSVDSVYMEDGHATARNSIFAYNNGDEIEAWIVQGYPAVDPDITVTRSCVYSPDGEAVSGFTLDETNITADPTFLVAPTWDEETGLWTFTDIHLALDSPLIDAGDPDILDPDGSRSDIGVYGGPDAGGWDRDGDGWNDWFWPGWIDDAPNGYDPAAYDCDDEDPDVQGCLD